MDEARMDGEATNGIQRALDGVREAMTLQLEALEGPYEALARSDPQSVLGGPLAVPLFRPPADVKAIASTVEENGRNAWALRQVEERESQLRGLVHDYKRGLYSTMSVVEWIGVVGKFREAALGDVMTAMQPPKGWARIDLSHRNSGPKAFDKPVLSPRDVAPELGIDERTVRRRITEGRLGPWKKEGRRWVISRAAFLGYWEHLAADSDQPHPPGAGEASQADNGLDHMRL